MNRQDDTVAKQLGCMDANKTSYLIYMYEGKAQ